MLRLSPGASSPGRIAPPLLRETGDADLQISETIPIDVTTLAPPEAPAYLMRGFASGTHEDRRRPTRREDFFNLIGDFFNLIGGRLKQMRGAWRRHLEQDVSNAKSGRRTGHVVGGAIALLSLLVIVICAGAVVAFTQIRSLKSEIANLQRELSPLRERVARADASDKARREAEQQKETQNRSATESNKPGVQNRIDQTPLILTPDEIRLIRDFIKPAPAAGAAAPAINVGDTVGIATIPLPSQLMEKIPKLLGARFTTRNGSIIIVRRDSRQADAVLGPN